MNKKWIAGLLSIVLLLTLVPASAKMQGNLDVCVVTPGQGGTVLPEGKEFATLEINDPWDMNNALDIVRVRNFADFSMSNGVWSGRSTSDDPLFYLLDPGYKGAYHINNRDGYVNPIDTSKYYRISFRMYLDWPTNDPPSNPKGQFYYFYNDYNLTDYAASNPFDVSEGWHVYTFDLRELGCRSGPPRNTYEGLVRGLRFDPINWPNTVVKIDWVRLTGDTPLESNTPIEWTVSDPDATVDLYSDTDTDPDNGVVDLIALGLSGDSYNWNSAILPPGTYYIHAEAHLDQQSASDCSDGVFVVNQAPRLNILSPSRTSGQDYATTVLGNSWDMDGASDIKYKDNVCNVSTTGGIYHADSCDVYRDNQLWPQFGGPVIDTSKYRYLTYRAKIDHAYPWDAANQGWVARVFWRGQNDQPSTSKDIYLYPDWNTYTVDLYTAALDEDNPFPSAKLWKDSQPIEFRYDPNEISNKSTIHLDYIEITARDQADGSFNICWELNDPDSNDVTLQISYEPVALGDQREAPSGAKTLIATIKPDGTVIPAAQAQTQATLSPDQKNYVVYLPMMMNSYFPPCEEGYVWQTSWMDPGDYYIVIDADDGYNVTTWRSESPLEIRH